MLRKYKIPITITAFIFTVILFYKDSTSRQWFYSQLVELFVPNLITNIEVGENLINSEYIILDARSNAEYTISHLPGSIWIGDDSLAIQRAQIIVNNNEIPYLIYCSIGYRSQFIGKQLQDSLGIKIVNLEGGIFKWNQKHQLLKDSLDNTTKEVHPYSFFWGLWRI